MDIWTEVWSAYGSLTRKSKLYAVAASEDKGLIQDDVADLTARFGTRLPSPLPEHSVRVTDSKFRRGPDGRREFSCEVEVSWRDTDEGKRLAESLMVSLPPSRSNPGRDADLSSWRTFRHAARPISAPAETSRAARARARGRSRGDPSEEVTDRELTSPGQRESQASVEAVWSGSPIAVLEAQRTQWTEVAERALKAVIASAHEEAMTPRFLESVHAQIESHRSPEDKKAELIFDEWAKHSQDTSTSDYDKALSKFTRSVLIHVEYTERPPDSLPVIITQLEPDWHTCTVHPGCLNRLLIMNAEHTTKIKAKQELHTLASLLRPGGHSPRQDLSDRSGGHYDEYESPAEESDSVAPQQEEVVQVEGSEGEPSSDYSDSAEDDSASESSSSQREPGHASSTRRPGASLQPPPAAESIRQRLRPRPTIPAIKREIQ